MAFRISRLRVVAVDDAGFPDLVSALPAGVDACLCCGWLTRHRLHDSLAMVLVADESDDRSRALYATVCPMCSTVHPADQLLADWAERLAGYYGGR